MWNSEVCLLDPFFRNVYKNYLGKSRWQCQKEVWDSFGFRRIGGEKVSDRRVKSEEMGIHVIFVSNLTFSCSKWFKICVLNMHIGFDPGWKSPNYHSQIDKNSFFNFSDNPKLDRRNNLNLNRDFSLNRSVLRQIWRSFDQKFGPQHGPDMSNRSIKFAHILIYFQNSTGFQTWFWI